MSAGVVTKEECLARHEELMGKLESIERRLFVDNGSPSIQTRLERHDLVIRALLWVVSVVAGTAIAPAFMARESSSGRYLLTYTPPPNGKSCLRYYRREFLGSTRRMFRSTPNMAIALGTPRPGVVLRTSGEPIWRP